MFEPDTRPMIVSRLMRSWPRAMQPTIISGSNVITKPQITHHIPVSLNTDAAKSLPAGDTYRCQEEADTQFAEHHEAEVEV